MNENTTKAGSRSVIGLGTLIFLVFLVLKILGMNGVEGLTWFAELSWFWVFFPLWIGLASIIGVCLILLLIAGVAELTFRINRKRRLKRING